MNTCSNIGHLPGLSTSDVNLVGFWGAPVHDIFGSFHAKSRLFHDKSVSFHGVSMVCPRLPWVLILVQRNFRFTPDHDKRGHTMDKPWTNHGQSVDIPWTKRGHTMDASRQRLDPNNASDLTFPPNAMCLINHQLCRACITLGQSKLINAGPFHHSLNCGQNLPALASPIRNCLTVWSPACFQPRGCRACPQKRRNNGNSRPDGVSWVPPSASGSSWASPEINLPISIGSPPPSL